MNNQQYLQRVNGGLYHLFTDFVVHISKVICDNSRLGDSLVSDEIIRRSLESIG